MIRPLGLVIAALLALCLLSSCGGREEAAETSSQPKLATAEQAVWLTPRPLAGASITVTGKQGERTATAVIKQTLVVERIMAYRGDTIVWKFDEEATIQFPVEGVLDVFPIIPLFDETQYEYRAQVLGDAPLGVYEYTIYFPRRGVFAEGESQPKIEIPG